MGPPVLRFDFFGGAGGGDALNVFFSCFRGFNAFWGILKAFVCTVDISNSQG